MNEEQAVLLLVTIMAVFAAGFAFDEGHLFVGIASLISASILGFIGVWLRLSE